MSELNERGKPEGRRARRRAPAAREGRVYGGKLPLERRAGRRQQVLDAAHELFGTRGYADTSIERICASAGVGIRTLYQEFGDREELFRQVYDNVIERAYAAVEEALEASVDEPLVGRLARGLEAHLHVMLDDPRCGRIVSIESAGLDRVMGAHRNRTLKRFAALLVMVLPGDVRRSVGDSRLWSLMLAGGLNEVIIDALISPGRDEIDEIATDLATIWSRTVQT